MIRDIVAAAAGLAGALAGGLAGAAAAEPVSPLAHSNGDTLLVVSSGGDALGAIFKVISVVVHHAVNKLPSARVTVAYAVDAPGQPPLADTAAFKPGARIGVDAGYGSRKNRIFDGVVVSLGVRHGNGGLRVVLECRDIALAMSLGRKSQNHGAGTDSAILLKLLAGYGGLTGEVAATSATHQELLQFDVSDWDFLLARAEANGMVVLVNAGAVRVAPPVTSGARALSLRSGVDLISIDADLDARGQLDRVDSASWDPATQSVLTHRENTRALVAQGDIGGAALSKVLGVKQYRLRANAALGSGALSAWAGGRQMRAALARLRGSMRFQGSHLARPGALVEIAGVGKRFDGVAWLSAVTHTVEGGSWTTEAQFGMAADSLAERDALAAPLAAGLTAGVTGLQIGVVKRLDGDPNMQHMVQISLPLMQAETDGVWARLASGYGSQGVGSFFIPEIGDEVVVGFLDSDPSHPLILGSLHSSGRAPPYPLSAANDTKAIVTRSKLTIAFDEAKKVVTIVTPGGNKVEISDDAKTITLLDETGNTLTLAPGGITLDSAKDIVLKAKGKVTVDAGGDIELTSKADLKEVAMHISSQASETYTASGATSAQLSAGGNTTVKGKMVMIN
jgi:Rhs element Vgr protein